MRCLSSSRRTALASFGLIPAIALLAACGSSSTSPRAQAMADTIGVNLGNSAVTEAYSTGGDTTYFTNDAISDGDYVEATNTNATNFEDYRDFVEFPLPGLRGRGVVDSARFAAYTCDNENFSGLHTGTAPHASGRAIGPRHTLRATSRTVHSLKATDSASVFLDHMDWGGSITGASYWGQALATDIGTLVQGSDGTTGWKTLSVTAAVAADYAAHRTNTQFRMRFNDAGFPPMNTYVGFFGEACDDNLGIGGPMTLTVWSH